MDCHNFGHPSLQDRLIHKKVKPKKWRKWSAKTGYEGYFFWNWNYRANGIVIWVYVNVHTISIKTNIYKTSAKNISVQTQNDF